MNELYSLDSFQEELEDVIELITIAEKHVKKLRMNRISTIYVNQLNKLFSLMIVSRNRQLKDRINEEYHEKYGSNIEDNFFISKSLEVNRRYRISLKDPVLPNVLLKSDYSTGAACAVHAVMTMFLSMGYSSNWLPLDNSVIPSIRDGFNGLNDNLLCTCSSELNDVLRTFTDMFSCFLPPTILYAAVAVKEMKNRYNISDFLKASTEANYSGKKTLNDIIVYDIYSHVPKWIVMDSGIYASGFNFNKVFLTLTVNNKYVYKLHSFVVNTGGHYVCGVLTEDNNCLIYDDTRTSLYTSNLYNYSFYRMSAFSFYLLKTNETGEEA